MIGERLADLRKDRRMTRKDLATQLSLSVHTIASYEQNKSTPDDDIKVKIALIFNISLDYLLGLTKSELALDRKYNFVLPSTLPAEAHNEMHCFIDYLKYKYRTDKNSP